MRADLRWKVGTGKDINIVGQSWLQDEQNPYITLSIQGLENFKVSALMAIEHKRWDEDTIRDLFNARDQDICKIHLSEDENRDILY